MSNNHVGRPCEDCSDGICTMNCSSAVCATGSEWIAASIWSGVFPAKASAHQVTEWRAATPAPAVDDDDIDSPAARLDMVRVALSGIIDNPASAVPLAKAGLDFCDLTQAQRQEMRGDA